MQKIMHCRRKYSPNLSSSVDLPADSDLSFQIHVSDFSIEQLISDVFECLPLRRLDLYCIFIVNFDSFYANSIHGLA